MLLWGMVLVVVVAAGVLTGVLVKARRRGKDQAPQQMYAAPTQPFPQPPRPPFIQAQTPYPPQRAPHGPVPQFPPRPPAQHDPAAWPGPPAGHHGSPDR